MLRSSTDAFSPVKPLGLVTFLLLVVAAACGSDGEDGLSAPVAGGSGGSGSGCTKDLDCPAASPVCDQLERRCVACLFDTQCDGGQRCVGKTCVGVVPCASSLNCVAHEPYTICDPVTSTCVECVEAADCPTTADCVANLCRPYQACSTSLDCSQGLVCDPGKGRCVKCAGDPDCADGQVCVANACVVRTPCQSDNQCTPLGKLCDKTLGYCVDCLGHDQCPDAYHCELGACVLDVCQAGATSCQGAAEVTCEADGSGWGAAQACPGGTACKVSVGCVALACTPGVSCQGDVLTTCSADGLTVLGVQDCGATGLRCVQGQCLNMACAPSQTYCEGNEVRLCNAQGSGSSLVQTCGANQQCDPATASCVSLLCTPGAAVCNGAMATTCNASGTGYVAGGTDCAAQGKACSNGVCTGCPSGGVAPSSVRLAEVFMGLNDFVVLVNRGSCPAQIDTLSLRIASSDSTNNLDIDMPARLLNGGERVYVVDKGAAQAGDIVSQENIFLTAQTGEYVMLCEGPCSSGVVLDYFAHASGAQPPLPPSGVTFTPAPLTGITTTNEDTHAYARVQYTGVSPSFKAADWAVDAVSRVHQNSPLCPATAPQASTTCNIDSALTCIYGSVACYCMPIFGWLCQ